MINSLVSVPDHSNLITRANSFHEFLRTPLKSDILFYADDYKLPDRKLGTEFAIFQMNFKICTDTYPIGKYNEVQDAETSAVL